mmetsp:Transcript_16458/g.42221  ORF Transcript_16458/g.42221 Transcript_16458/m.42221 type:complete len:308 (+) Transcript_16458:832-1755(+)
MQRLLCETMLRLHSSQLAQKAELLLLALIDAFEERWCSHQVALTAMPLIIAGVFSASWRGQTPLGNLLRVSRAILRRCLLQYTSSLFSRALMLRPCRRVRPGSRPRQHDWRCMHLVSDRPLACFDLLVRSSPGEQYPLLSHLFDVTFNLMPSCGTLCHGLISLLLCVQHLLTLFLRDLKTLSSRIALRCFLCEGIVHHELLLDEAVHSLRHALATLSTFSLEPDERILCFAICYVLSMEASFRSLMILFRGRLELCQRRFQPFGECNEPVCQRRIHNDLSFPTCYSVCPVCKQELAKFAMPAPRGMS